MKGKAQIHSIVFLFSQILSKMNEDYKTTLATHDPQQDLNWWDQNYGM